MSNKTLTELNDYLFDQLSRLSNPDLSGDELEHELSRSKGIEGISKEIVSNARLSLDAQIKVGETISKTQLPKMLEVTNVD